eukprot:symbB.v1.2.028683.t1/scaffold3057.1/size64513/1
MNLSATVQSLEEGNARVHVSVNIDASQRFHANLCLVIDVSGSMQLPAALKDREATELSILDIVVHSCRTVIHSLTADDCLAIVTYSDAARVVLPLTPMDDNGKAAAEASLKTLRADGQTNLWQGLETALDLLHAGQRGGSLSSALLLTDGVPNVEPPGGHMEALERYKAAKGGKQLPCTLHTFGFGNDLDSKLLDDLAGASGGCYVFIPDAGFVGTALVNCTACAVTSAGRNAHLNLEGATVTHCWGYADCHAGVVALGALQLGQSKDRYVVRFRESHESHGFPELLNNVLQLSHTLTARANLTSGDRIGICFERTSLTAIIALLSALHLQLTYVPLPSGPSGSATTRLGQLIELALLRAVLCSRQTVEEVFSSWPRKEAIFNVDDFHFSGSTKMAVPETAPGSVPNEILYVIFTSGSTGRPK